LDIDLQMDEQDAEGEMEIAENVPLIQNAYKIFKNTMKNHWKENSERNTICHRKKLPVRGRNLLAQEETYSQGKKLPVT
jgi:hypothetical protein